MLGLCIPKSPKNRVALLADLRPSVSAFRFSAFALVTEFRTNNLNRGINFKDAYRSVAPALDLVQYVLQTLLCKSVRLSCTCMASEYQLTEPLAEVP